jgi:hypothetical protein
VADFAQKNDFAQKKCQWRGANMTDNELRCSGKWTLICPW